MVTTIPQTESHAPGDEPITGVAPGATYDSTLTLLYDDSTDAPTVKLAALSPAATVKMPVVVFDVEVSA